MSHITADDALVAQLRGVAKRVEIRDASGDVLGYYVPVAEDQKAKFERVKHLFDLEEAGRTLAAERDKGFTTEEVLRHLESLKTK